jgi:hypothetical protein
VLHGINSWIPLERSTQASVLLFELRMKLSIGPASSEDGKKERKTAATAHRSDVFMVYPLVRVLQFYIESRGGGEGKISH